MSCLYRLKNVIKIHDVEVKEAENTNRNDTKVGLCVRLRERALAVRTGPTNENFKKLWRQKCRGRNSESRRLQQYVWREETFNGSHKNEGKYHSVSVSPFPRIVFPSTNKQLPFWHGLDQFSILYPMPSNSFADSMSSIKISPFSTTSLPIRVNSRA